MNFPFIISKNLYGLLSIEKRRRLKSPSLFVYLNGLGLFFALFKDISELTYKTVYKNALTLNLKKRFFNDSSINMLNLQQL